ncbi:MAG: hypothetical protein LBV52_01005 [Spirochaetaceae bacterium]|jgi:hypothetical protein|nr:hypothetical protein [Spirochaetaceae bacterium]
MNDVNQYALICCSGCVQYPCRVKCKKTAIAFTNGNLIIDSLRCSGCADAKQNGVPECITKCKHSNTKNILAITNTETKHVKAVSVLPLL